jgi:hypothetical protein
VGGMARKKQFSRKLGNDLGGYFKDSDNIAIIGK